MNETIVRVATDASLSAEARSFSVKGKVVLITGAAQGIGREFARQFAGAGAAVVVADINVDKARQVADEITGEGGIAKALAVDIGSEESVEEMTRQALAEFGRIDVLLNNGAIFASLAKRPFYEIPLDEWNKVMHVNITGSFLCARSVSAAMRKAKSGAIINISSASYVLGAKDYLHYVTSKAAIIGMTNSLARELGPFGITVNSIKPGGVATEVDRTHNPTVETRTRLSGAQCLERGQVPSDLVGLAIFLATPAGAFITGQNIACDGGLTHGY